MNEGFVRLTGYSRDEVLGKNCRFLQGSQTDQLQIDKIRKAINLGVPCTVEILNYRKDGTPFWNRLSITPLRDYDGNITHYVGIQSDITELKQTKDQLEKANVELMEFQTLIHKELDQAKIAQEFLLPRLLPRNTKIMMASKFVPMTKIGGDFYDVININPTSYGILMADVVGHGIPAALVTFMSSTAFKNVAVANVSPQSVISQTNNRLYLKMPDDSFLTMFYAVYNTESRKLVFTQAGHVPALWIKPSSKSIIPLETQDPLVGAFGSDEIRFTEKEVIIDPGDRILLYTDAIIETLNDSGLQLGIEGLIDFIDTQWELSLDDLLTSIYNFGLQRTGQSVYNDDFSVLALEVLA